MSNSVELHMNIKITPEGILIGQCKEFPAVIVQANSKEQLIEEMKDGVIGLYEVFPKEFAAMAAKYAKGVKDITKPSGIKKKVESIVMQIAVN
jgi:hypothetical protein